MYNEQLKTEFIESNIQSEKLRKICRDLFVYTEEYETKCGKDIYAIDDAAVLQQLIDGISGIRSKSAYQRMRLLRMYISWCEERGYPIAHQLGNLKPSNEDKVRIRMVASPFALQAYLNKITPPEDEETVGNVIRLWYWFAYSGLAEADVFNITAKNIDLNNLLIEYNGDSFEIYREALPALRNCINLKQFHILNRKSYRERLPGDVLLRGTGISTKSDNFRTTIASTISAARSSGATDMRLTYKSTWLSGVFYRQFLRESAGLRAEFLGVAQLSLNGKSYSSTLEKSKVRAALANDYMKDYRIWKSVFYGF